MKNEKLTEEKTTNNNADNQHIQHNNTSNQHTTTNTTTTQHNKKNGTSNNFKKIKRKGERNENFNGGSWQRWKDDNFKKI